MSLTRACVRKDLLRIARDPWSVWVWLLIPILLALLMTASFGGNDEGFSARPTVLLVDEDESAATALIRALSAQRWADDAAELIWLDREQALAQLEDGRASAMLVFPAGLQSAWLDGEPMQLPLALHPAQRILPSMVLEAAEMATELAERLRQLVGPELRVLAESGGSGLEMLPAGLRVGEVGTLIERWLDPPRLSVRSVVPARAPSPSLVSVMLPGWIWMALVFMAQGLSGDVWREREEGTLRRALAVPGGGRALLLGKLGAGATVAGLILAAGLVIASFTRDADFVDTLLAWGFGVLCFVGFHAPFLWLALCVGSARAASLVGSLVVFPLLMLGGSFFPLEALPAPIATVGAFTPTGWTQARFAALLNGTAEPLDALIGVALIVAIVLLCTRFADRRLRGRFAVGAPS